MNRSSKIYVAGHRGLVGSAIVRYLRKNGYSNFVLRTRAELDLTDSRLVENFFNSERPEYVFDAAAKVGGILANDTYPADFLLDNLRIQNNLIDSAFKSGVKKFLFLGSSCIYPKNAKQPMAESSLLRGELETTNQWYAIAKIAGIKLCQAYRKQHGFNSISIMPTNLYGPGDNFNLETSHVLPALIRKFHEAKIRGKREVVVWGTGKPMREFLHVDDLASALVFLMQNYNDSEIINVGSGIEISITELAEQVKAVIGFEGDIVFDTEKPDGTPRKLLDVTKINRLGWRASTDLESGVWETYRWFLENKEVLRDGANG